MTKKMLVPGIHFRTGGLDSSQHLRSVFVFWPCPRQGNPLRTAISPPSPSIHCPAGFHSQPLFPLSLLGRHVFKLCPETEGAISLSVASIDSFQDAEDLLPLIPAPSQPTNSPHLPPSQLSALGWGIPSPSAFICLLQPYSPHTPVILPPAFLCALNVPFSPSPAPTSLTPLPIPSVLNLASSPMET